MLSVHVFSGVVLLRFVNSILSSDVTMRSGMSCAQNSDIPIKLQCSVNERIHVEKESYGDGATNPCRFQTNESCRDVLESSIHGLAVNCNGKQSCNETVSPVNCNRASPAAAEVQYKCISGSRDICGFDSINTAANESVYLHSPDYPHSLGLNRSCVVRISGKGIQVTLVEQSLNGGNLTISGNVYKKWSNVNAKLYNRKLAEQDSELVIFYTDEGNNGSNVWISVVGSSPMSVTFNGGMITSSATSTLLVPISEVSSPQLAVTSQRMSVTQSVKPTSTLSTDTQAPSIESTSVLSSTLGTDLVSLTATTTVKMISKTSVTTMRIAPTTSSITENLTVGTTSSETSHIPRTPDEDMVVVVASIAAGCVVVVIVVVVIAVVLCRCKRDKAKRSASSHNGGIDRPLELISPHNRTPNGLRKHDGSQHYFIIDSTLVPGNADTSFDPESRGNEGTRTMRAQDGYSIVLPRSSRLNMKGNSTFTIKHPRSTPSPANPTGSNEEKDIEDTESPEAGDLKDDTDLLEPVDSFQFDRGNSTRSTCHMIENDVYNGGPPTAENHDVSIDDGNQDEESTPEDDLYHGEDASGSTVEVMLDNDIYESSGYDTTVAEQNGECEEPTRDIIAVGSANEEIDMVTNDIYHSFV